jgi:hypothetical protein
MKRNKKYWKKAFKQSDKDWRELAHGHKELWNKYDCLYKSHNELKKAYKDTGVLLTEARDEIDALKKQLREAMEKLSYIELSNHSEYWESYYARHPEQKPRHAHNL